jgi:O-antigen/teichoic acid export membrane protein
MSDAASTINDARSGDSGPEFAEPTLSGEDVRQRAVSGAAIILGRGLSVKVVAFGGNVVLARLLLPEDFGIVAFGLTLITLASFIGDGGLGAALIRADRSPTRIELGAVSAVQIAAACAIATAAALSALPFGSAALLTAVMVASLPIAALQTPAAIMFERSLSYGPLALVTIVETLSYFIWAIGLVALGAGAWGLATATVVRAICGTTTMFLVSPIKLVLPRWNLGPVRPLLRFGLKYQAAMLAGFVRDHGVNVGTAAIAGVAGLGLWSLAGRIMQVPAILFESLWSVSYPAMARLRDAGEDLAPVIERGMRLTVVGTGILLAPLIAAAPALIPSVFGEQWGGAVDLVTILPLALLISGPISVATTGFLYTVGDAGSVLVALVGNALVNVVGGLILL